jgi:rod shape-determining protein MreC
MPASVIYKSITGIQMNFALNRGSSDGVRAGCPVITGDGLIGVVQTVSSNYSIVRTLKNSDLKLIVRDERSRIDGILKYNGSDVMISNLPKTADIKIGDRVVTSNYSSLVNFPILIGKVKKIVNPEQGSMNNVIITPSVNFDKAENVFVILNTSTINFTLPSQLTSSAN